MERMLARGRGDLTCTSPRRRHCSPGSRSTASCPSSMAWGPRTRSSTASERQSKRCRHERRTTCRPVPASG
jgi:hypothetical protein